MDFDASGPGVEVVENLPDLTRDVSSTDSPRTPPTGPDAPSPHRSPTPNPKPEPKKRQRASRARPGARRGRPPKNPGSAAPPKADAPPKTADASQAPKGPAELAAVVELLMRGVCLQRTVATRDARWITLANDYVPHMAPAYAHAFQLLLPDLLKDMSPEGQAAVACVAVTTPALVAFLTTPPQPIPDAPRGG